MTTNTLARGACEQKTHDGLWATLTAAWTGTLAHWREARAIAEAEDTLSAMDDRMLKDIGIARDDIHRVVRRPRQR